MCTVLVKEDESNIQTRGHMQPFFVPRYTARYVRDLFSQNEKMALFLFFFSLLFPFLSRPISTLDLAYISHVSIFVRGQVFKGNNDLSTHNIASTSCNIWLFAYARGYICGPRTTRLITVCNNTNSSREFLRERSLISELSFLCEAIVP